MPTPTYDLIASNISNGSASVISFTSIPATYRDLILVVSSPATGSGANQIVGTFNSDTGSNYARVTMLGNGSSTSTDSNATGSVIAFGVRGQDQPSVAISHIMDYSATDKHKSVLVRTDSPQYLTRADAYRWANTSAINSISFEISIGGNINSGISFYLYGIAS